MLIEESEILLADLPVEAFKAHLRLGRGFSGDTVQDSVLESFLRAAIASVEGRCGKALMIRNFIWTLPFWQDDLRQVFPIGPVQEVLELALLDAAEQPTVVDPARFRLEKDMHFPALNGRSAGLPNPPADGSIRVQFTAGYGATWDEVPRDLAQAVMLQGAHYYEHREATGLGEGCAPFGVISLTERYRPMRIFTRGRV
ncbi:head-tail connector protein [Pseudooceanicola nitratireducens]|jgi:uncharacterized phiE125 gp8 family phage protein|uniref:head-tail connector protein n=1 Tax=Pseudooceanicola nitratireducens TaxID=517719 RepID=UPI003518FF83